MWRFRLRLKLKISSAMGGDFEGQGYCKETNRRHLCLIEGSLTRMINEMERTISKGVNRQLENLVIDFSIGKKKEGKRIE